jgi:hypothetical protein
LFLANIYLINYYGKCLNTVHIKISDNKNVDKNKLTINNLTAQKQKQTKKGIPNTIYCGKFPALSKKGGT